MIFCDWQRDSKVIRRITPMKPCAGCDASIPAAGKAPNFYCVSCKDKSMSLRYRLYREVKEAIKRGDLLPISQTKCVDCGGKANGYEHRDWLKPLDVVPICRSCNWKRGPAKNLGKVA